ncbi:MAG: hypothetical protein IJH94_02205 [Clostridia bacterium]|nr:hypothetical protein [Clostridia bacterium]
MDKQIDLIAEDVAREAAKAVKNRLGEIMLNEDKITYASALAALDEIKEAVNMIRPNLETVVAIKHILSKYNIEPLDQLYFLKRAKMDSATVKKKHL